jgi:hypothetical protein
MRLFPDVDSDGPSVCALVVCPSSSLSSAVFPGTLG